MIKEQQLELLGLSDKEARLYVAALKLGSFSVQEIAAKSGLKRPTCYIILDELTRRGLISMVLTEKKKQYKAESPNVFIRQAKNNLKYAEQIVPSLLSMRAEDGERPKLKYYIGQKGMQNIYDDLLNTRSKNMYYISSTKSQIETVSDEFLRDYVKRRAAKGIHVKTIRMREDQSNEPLYNESKEMLREVRYAPKGIYIPDTICVIGHKVSVVFTAKGNFGFIIESPEFSQTILSMFKAIWSISTKN